MTLSVKRIWCTIFSGTDYTLTHWAVGPYNIIYYAGYRSSI